MLDAVLDSRSGAQQQDEHEYPPGYAETGEKGPQPVGAYGGEYFLEQIEIYAHFIFTISVF
jgi:hypothetical protein